MLFTVYISDIPVTLKQSQGHQTYYDNVDSKHGYKHAKYESSCFDGVREKANVEVCFTSNEEYMSIISLEHVRKINKKNSGIFMICLT